MWLNVGGRGAKEGKTQSGARMYRGRFEMSGVKRLSSQNVKAAVDKGKCPRHGSTMEMGTRACYFLSPARYATRRKEEL